MSFQSSMMGIDLFSDPVAAEDAAEAERKKREAEEAERRKKLLEDAAKMAEQEAARQSSKGVSSSTTYQGPDGKKPAVINPTTAKPNTILNPPTKQARDGQTLSQQSPGTQSAFQTRYGDKAAEAWVREHEAELQKNIGTYGMAEPTAGTKALNPKLPDAPDRTIGRTPHPVANPVINPENVPANTWRPTDPTTGQSSTPATPPTPATPGVPTTGAPTSFAPRVPPTTVPDTGAAYNPANAAPTETTVPAAANASVPTVSPGTPPAPTIAGDWVAVKDSQTGAVRWIPRSSLATATQWGDTVHYDPQARPAPVTTTTKLSNTEGISPTMQAATATVASQPADPYTQAASTTKPVDTILQLNGKDPKDATPILQGISALLSGNPEGAWTEPYLNDIARLAWAKQEQQQGRNVDPRDAPVGYIESWKDAFFGSDPSVPLVKEVDQQMIDYGVQKAQATGKPFNWKDAFGATGEGGLISTQTTTNDCGPNAASTVLRSMGYNADPGQMFQYAKQKGYHNGEEFTGPHSFARMLTQEAGIPAEAIPMDWTAVDAELAAGRVVVLSSRGHYWAVSARRDGPNGPEYYTGATGSIVSNPEWAQPGQIRYNGAPDTMIVTRGTASPQAPVVQALGLKPPGAAQPNRMLLSSQTTRQQAEQRVNMSAQQSTQRAQPASSDEDLVYQLANEEGADPVLILAVMEQESGGDQSAVSSAGATGKMQLMPDTAREMGVDPNDPVDNVRGGIRYLTRMLKRYDGNIDLALAAYNAGPGAVDMYGGIPPYPETQNYVRIVKANLQRRLNEYAGAR